MIRKELLPAPLEAESPDPTFFHSSRWGNVGWRLWDIPPKPKAVALLKLSAGFGIRLL
jgi:hypothetical protein